MVTVNHGELQFMSWVSWASNLLISWWNLHTLNTWGFFLCALPSHPWSFLSENGRKPYPPTEVLLLVSWEKILPNLVSLQILDLGLDKKKGFPKLRSWRLQLQLRSFREQKSQFPDPKLRDERNKTWASKLCFFFLAGWSYKRLQGWETPLSPQKKDESL